MFCLIHPQDKCNSVSCGYDGLDCAPGGSNPWVDCPTPVLCKQAFGDGHCSVECNYRECLYDGGECTPVEMCPRSEECIRMVGDGVCQQHCYTPQCLYDFQDCQLSASAEFVSASLTPNLVWSISLA